MLFNSYIFMFAFLPVALIGFYIAALCEHRLARGWLVLCSFFFYGWWNPHFVLLLLGSIAFNYAMNWAIHATDEQAVGRQQALLTIGITGNLLLLFFYKYLLAVIGFFGLLSHPSLGWARAIILPLGISFFTFTQIGYLIDSAQGLVKRHNLIDYVLFVTFFPHLIAGPILHNREMIPQFAEPATYRLELEDLAVGMSIFVIGLCKKVVIADPFSSVADAGFASPSLLSTYGAWETVLSYALQLYFDFSGYSDMAIGIARMFGISFPLNFNSPYKSRCIIDFWQRWHMTLTRYLTLYLFNPMALWITRRRAAKGLSTSRRAVRSVGGFTSMVMFPMFFTMSLAGIWHGAGLQFLVFGLLHGTYLSINHAWRAIRPAARNASEHGNFVHFAGVGASIAITFFAVLIAQVFFRAPSAAAAVSMLRGLLGLHPVAGQILVPASLFRWTHGIAARLSEAGLITPSQSATQFKHWLRICVGFAIVWGLPNTQQIMVGFKPALESVRPFPIAVLRWRPNIAWGVAIGMLLIVSLCNLDNPSRFLYFQF